MKRTSTTALITFLAVLALGVGALLITIFTGAYNVAATEAHWPVTRWAFNTLQDHSVSERAASIEGTPPRDSAALAHGFEHFHSMCVQCHGAPGLDRGEIGEGMRPLPPRLEEKADEWTDGELFWMIRNGIRLAGMPAFGATHSDEEIWSIVGFLRQLETMTEAEYADRVRATFGMDDPGDGTGDGTGGHPHAPGTPAHGH